MDPETSHEVDTQKFFIGTPNNVSEYFINSTFLFSSQCNKTLMCVTNFSEATLKLEQVFIYKNLSIFHVFFISCRKCFQNTFGHITIFRFFKLFLKSRANLKSMVKLKKNFLY